MKKYFEISLRRLLVMTATVLLALAWSGQVQAADELSLQLLKGLLAEEAHRDYNAALKAYQAAVAAYDTNRQAAATAVFRLAETYQKLGKTNEARAQYERVVFEFADQLALAGAASKQLGFELGKSSVSDLLAAKIPDEKIELYLRSDLRMREAQLAGLRKLNWEDLALTVMRTAYDEQLNSLLKARDELRMSKAIRLKEYAPGHPELQKLEAALKVNEKLITTNVQVYVQQLEEKVKLLREQLDSMAQAGSIATRPQRVPGQDVMVATAPQIPAEEQAEIERLQAMLKNSPDLINAPVEGNSTLLIKAAGAGQLAVAEFLIKNGADVNRQAGGLQWTPLFVAAQKGHKAMAELLLKAGANKEATDNNGQTSLIEAASRGFRSVVGELIGAGANVNAQDGGGYSALHYAAAAGNYEMTEQLLKAKADPKLKTTVTRWENRKDEKGATPLHLAVKANNPAVVSGLLAAGAEVNAQDANGWTPLVQAFSEGTGNILKRLLDAKADVRVRSLGNYSILHFIKKTTTAELVGQLLQAGAVVNVADDKGSTPLISAVQTENIAVAKLLLEHGADPNVLPRDGMSPLLSAISSKNADMVRLLLANKAKTELLPGAALWQHPVVVAAKQTEVEMLKALIDHGADLSVTNDKGYTSLHYAVAAMNVPMVELLVKHKADPNAVHPGSGETPVTLAQGGKVIDLDDPERSSRALPARSARTVPGMFTSTGVRLTEQEIKAKFEEIVKLLVEHGGDEFFKRRKTITVTRTAKQHEQTVFYADANKVNRFSLYELLAIKMGDYMNANGLEFPDLAGITINRLEGKQVTSVSVNLLAALETGDCQGDIWLEWGDVVEIPELDHSRYEQWPGFNDAIRKALSNCCKRSVALKVKGQSHIVDLHPAVIRSRVPRPGVPSVPGSVVARNTEVVTLLLGCRLSQVVFESKALLASSDTKRIKVIRKLPGTGETKEMVYDIGAVQSSPDDLWLRDGDVIEVPEKE